MLLCTYKPRWFKHCVEFGSQFDVVFMIMCPHIHCVNCHCQFCLDFTDTVVHFGTDCLWKLPMRLYIPCQCCKSECDCQIQNCLFYRFNGKECIPNSLQILPPNCKSPDTNVSLSDQQDSKIVFCCAHSSKCFHIRCLRWYTKLGLDLWIRCSKEWICVKLVLNCTWQGWNSLLIHISSVRLSCLSWNGFQLQHTRKLGIVQLTHAATGVS